MTAEPRTRPIDRNNATQRVVPLEELRLLPPLVKWLRRTRRVRSDTVLLPEVRWLGRRIDLVTRTRTGSLTAYELKLAHITRALEQAVYNSAAFDRSYVVTEAVPRPENIAHASLHGVGILIVRDDRVRLLLGANESRPDGPLRRRLLTKLSTARGDDV